MGPGSCHHLGGYFFRKRRFLLATRSAIRFFRCACNAGGSMRACDPRRCVASVLHFALLRSEQYTPRLKVNVNCLPRGALLGKRLEPHLLLLS